MIPLLLFATLAFADPTVQFIKSFPGSDPAYVEINIDHAGAVTYREDPGDDEPEKFQLDPAEKTAIFDLAARLDHFARPLESGLKVANLGRKTFTWTDGEEKHQVKFNFSLDIDARNLQDWFERISESERLLAALDRTTRHDKLGVNDAVIAVEEGWDRKRLVAPEQFLTPLDQIAKNDVFMHMARERAARLADAIRAAKSRTE